MGGRALPAVVVVDFSAATAGAAEATLPAAGAANGERGRRRMGAGTGRGGWTGVAAADMALVVHLRRFAGTTQTTSAPPQDKATSDRLGLHQPLQL